MIRQKSFLVVALAGLSVLGLAAGAPVNSDRSKEEIEGPARQVIAKNSGVRAAAESGQPKVVPGNVKWHATLAAACEAARKSGKPVLLFQMMGKLDEQFC